MQKLILIIPQYYKEILNSKFVLCPPSYGEDTCRIWDSLSISAIPIVRKSFLSSLFKDLPVLQVNNWEEITEELLLSFYDNFKTKLNNNEYELEKLTKKYWCDMILNIQKWFRTKHQVDLFTKI